MKKSCVQFSMFLLIFLLCFTFSCQQPAEELVEEVKVGALTDEDIAEIRSKTEAFLQAWKSDDWTDIEELYTEDAIVMPAGESIVQGRETIQAWLPGIAPIEANITILEIDGRGDLAYVRGTYSQTYEPIGESGPIQKSGKYLEIRRKQQDGSWPIAIHFFD